VISIESMGTFPVRILPQAARTSRAVRLGFGLGLVKFMANKMPQARS
jgi:hypothetical protein